jgi:hypothetical protein
MMASHRRTIWSLSPVRVGSSARDRVSSPRAESRAARRFARGVGPTRAQAEPGRQSVLCPPAGSYLGNKHVGARFNRDVLQPAYVFCTKALFT